MLSLNKPHINKYWLVLGLIALDFVFFGNTNATKIPVQLIIIGFILLMCNLYLFTTLMIKIAKFYGFPIIKTRRLAAYLVISLTVITALKSIGELSPKDIIVILPLILIGYLYTSYFASDKKQIS